MIKKRINKEMMKRQCIFDTIDDEEEQEKEATEEGTQDDEETDPIKIVVAVITSFPHSPRKIVTTSNMEKSLVGFIATTTDNINIQSIFALV